MWTLLFDIDGTLVRTRGAGMAAIHQAMSELFDVSDLPKVTVHGRTDYGIVGDLFRPYGIDVDQNIEAFMAKYWEYLPASLETGRGIVLAGVPELLESLSKREDVVLGIVTGNTRRSAQMKLEYFGLSELFSNQGFSIGGYGDKSADRNDVAQMAFESASATVGADFDASKVWVIGDTPNDVRCGRSINARVAAVATGGCGVDELTEASPDLMFDSFEDHLSVIDSLLNS